jgi:hypothetical protein
MRRQRHTARKEGSGMKQYDSPTVDVMRTPFEDVLTVSDYLLPEFDLSEE